MDAGDAGAAAQERKPLSEPYQQPRNLAIQRAVANGNTPECRSLIIRPSAAFAGTIAGQAYAPADGEISLLAPESDVIAAIPFTVTAGSLLIIALA